MTPESALTFFIATLFFAISPGPGVFAVIATTLTQGIRGSIPLITGIIASDCIYLLLACYGMALIAETWSLAFMVIRYLGAAYLIYLGWKLWTAPISHDNNYASPNQNLSRFMQGFWISASNPKVIVFYLTLLPLLIDLRALNLYGFLTAISLTALGLLLGLLLIACLTSTVRVFFCRPAAMGYLTKTSGVVMAGAGGYLGARD